MSSQPRSTEPPVSLPSIHELFPEHLMHSPPAPGSPRTHLTVPHGPHRHTSSTASTHYRSHAQSPSFARPRDEASRAAPESAYHYPSHNPNDNYAPHSRATYGHRPLGAPHGSEPPAEDSSSYSPSQQMPMPHYLDNHQHDRSGHPVVSIPSSHSGRPPKGQDPHSYPTANSITHPGSSQPPPPLDDPELSDEDTTSTGAPSGIPRKHICPICRKAFNRPSSLKIHYNTHTGATPFRCPWPKCGREFNVNSNMRRHYRNHTANANQESQDDGARRRRRRSSASSPNPPPSLPVMQQSVGETRSQPHNSGGPRHQATNTSQYDSRPSDSSHHQYSRYRVYDYSKDYQSGMDVDTEGDEYHVSEDPHRSSRLPVPVMRASQVESEPRGSEQLHPASRYPGALIPPQERTHRHHHSHSSASNSSSNMRIRALTPGSSFHSSSPSPSPSPSLSSNASPFNSPPPSTLTSPVNSPAMLPRTGTHAAGQQQYHYSPSMPYLRSNGEPHVSTALRPAFNISSTRR